jgi:protein tyrosine/serine phosphatase
LLSLQALIVGLLTLSNFSRRAEKKVRSMFIDTINDGGLGLLNQFVFKNSGNELSSILKIIAEEENHPVVMYCTAGKDRTGVIAMLVLSILGVSDADIVRDYVKSDSAYADINDSKALVAGLKQVDVDPNIFLRAFPEVMEQSLTFVRSTYGSVDNYLDSVGFDESWRRKLRLALLAK